MAQQSADQRRTDGSGTGRTTEGELRAIIEALGKRELQLAQAQRIAHIGSWEWDIAPDRVAWSDELYRVFGVAGDSGPYDYSGYVSLIHPDDRDQAEAEIACALAEGTAFEHEHRILRPDGSVRIVHCHGEVVRDDEGVAQQMFGTCQDVTDRRRLEEDSARFWSLSLDLLTIVDAEGRIEAVNPAHRQLLGYEAGDLEGRLFAELVHPEDRARSLEKLERLVGGGPETADYEVRVRAKDGSYRTLLASARYSAQQGLVYAAAKDVTERRRAEAQVELERELAVAIGEASSFEGALGLALCVICERTGWVIGQAWMPAEHGSHLECSSPWHSQLERLEPFRRRSEEMTFGPGEGLPGRTWSAKRSIWMADVRADPGFVRSQIAREVGIGAGLGVPVLAGDEVVAVLEFFVPEPCAEDEQLVGLVSAAAAQLGFLVRRKQAQEALRTSEERFRLMLENVRDYAILMLDPSGHVASWNPSAQRITGYSADEIVGYHISRFYMHEDVAVGEADRDLERAMEAGRSEQSGWRVRKDGLQYWATVVITALRDDAGELRGFSYVTHDRSEQKQAEEELQRLSAIVENSDDAIIGTTPERSIITSWNRGAERLFGYSAREMIGRPVTMIVPPEELAALSTALDGLRAGKRIDQVEVEVLRRNDSRVDVSLTISPIRRMTGELSGVSLIARDITERKRSQRTLEQALGTYLDADVAEHILRHGPSLAGEEVDVSMMFVDIRDFTAFAERFEPAEVVETLNQLFELAVPIIEEHGGHVDKFVGDGLLAVFGTPQPEPRHACHALMAALEIERAAGERFQGDLEIGIGVDSGRVVAGNVGGGGRLDFTVIGSAVNTASRVEAATRETGDTLLITEATARRAGDCGVVLEKRSNILLKGKGRTVPLYAVLGSPSERDDERP
jgi:PAS domain S-box-containing protein